jgi:Tetratricopeptide repeat
MRKGRTPGARSLASHKGARSGIDRGFLALLVFYAAALAALFIGASTEGHAWWAFVHWRAFGAPVRVALLVAGALIAIATAAAAWRARAREVSDAPPAAREAEAPPDRPSLRAHALAIAGFLLVALAAHNENVFFGDIKLYEDKFEAARTGSILRDPVDRLPDRVIMTIDYALFRIGRGVLPGLRARHVFNALSIAAGIAYVLVALRLAWRLSPATPRATDGAPRPGAGSQRSRGVALLLLFSSPAVILFLGYGEHYGVIAAGAIAATLAAHRASQGEISHVWPLAISLATAAAHLGGIVLLPAALLIAWRMRRAAPQAVGELPPRRLRHLPPLLISLASAAIVAALLALVATRPPDSTLGPLLLPHRATPAAAYTIQSLDHLSFIANEIAFIGLVPLAALLATGLRAPFRDRTPEFDREGALDAAASGAVDASTATSTQQPFAASSRPRQPFLLFVGTMLVCALAFTALVDPKLGVRDWDLVSIFFVPISVLTAWAVSRRGLDDGPSIVLIAALMLLHTGTWIASNADATRAAKVTIEWAESDARYTRPQAGGREDVTPFLKLASILERAGLEEEALHCARRSTDVAPASRESWLALGKMLRNAGRREEAVEALRRAAALDPGSYVPPYLEGLCLGEMGRFEEALVAIERALLLAPVSATAEIQAAREECLRRTGR